MDGLTERTIRRRLRQRLEGLHADESDCLIVDEFTLDSHRRRADVAVINGSMHAYEIKSERDTLVRLPGQIEAYEACFDFASVVTTARHRSAVEAILPQTFGLIEATPEGLDVIREASRNAKLEAHRVVSFLRRDEAWQALRDHEIHHGLRTARVHVLYAKLVDSLTIEQLTHAVRDAFKRRGDWRANRQQFGGDGSSRSPAKSSGSRCVIRESRPLEWNYRPS